MLRVKGPYTVTGFGAGGKIVARKPARTLRLATGRVSAFRKNPQVIEIRATDSSNTLAIHEKKSALTGRW